jgi:tetratricopeptide (TPR) repeat protein
MRAASNRPEGLMARGQLARTYVADGNLQEADRLIAEVLKENPNDNQALLLRAQLALARGRGNDAIADLRRLLKERPDSAQIVTLLAKAHLLNDEAQLARGVLDDAVARYPHHAELRLAMIEFLIGTRDLSAALKEIDAALSIHPKNAALLQRRVRILADKRDWRAAEDAAVEMKRAAPDQAQGHYQLGLLYQQQKRYHEAAREFEAALGKATNKLKPLSALVNTLIAQGKGGDAIGKIQQFGEDLPSSQPLDLMLAAAYASEERYAEAEDAFQKAIQADANSAASYLALSNFHLTRGNPEAAIRVLQQGIGSNPASPALRVSLAEAYHRSGDYEKAIAAYQSSLAKQPANDIVSNNLAFLLTEVKGDAASLAQALELAKGFETASNPFYMDTLGWIYVKLGRLDLALPLLERAVQTLPEPLFQYHLAVALHGKGEVASAKKRLERALKAKQAFMGIEVAKAMYAKL